MFGQKGTTAQRPGSPASGDLRVNTETDKTEVYNGTEWRNFKESTVTTSVDYLVVAGGGGGGQLGGGGGAGGLKFMEYRTFGWRRPYIIYKFTSGQQLQLL